MVALFIGILLSDLMKYLKPGTIPIIPVQIFHFIVYIFGFIIIFGSLLYIRYKGKLSPLENLLLVCPCGYLL